MVTPVTSPNANQTGRAEGVGDPSQGTGPLTGYRGDFDQNGYQVKNFEANPLSGQPGQQNAKLALTNITAGVGRAACKVGMSARAPEPAFAHLVYAASQGEGIFEFANSRAMINHLDHTANRRELPEKPRFDSTTIGQIVKAFYSNEGKVLNLGEGYTLNSIKIERPEQGDANSYPTQMREITMQLTRTTNGQVEQLEVHCVVAYLASFDGTDLKNDQDLIHANAALQKLSDRTEKVSSQILSSTGCGRAAALAAFFNASKQKGGQKADTKEVTTKATEFFDAGASTFHTRFGLNKKLKDTVTRALNFIHSDKGRAYAEELSASISGLTTPAQATKTSPPPSPRPQAPLNPGGRVGQSPAPATAPAPATVPAPATAPAHANAPSTSTSTSTHLTGTPQHLLDFAEKLKKAFFDFSNAGTGTGANHTQPKNNVDTNTKLANHCYVDAMNGFMGLTGNSRVLSAEFLNHMVKELVDAYDREVLNSVGNLGAFKTALSSHSLTYSESNGSHPKPLADLLKVYESKELSPADWISRHRGDSATLISLLNERLKISSHSTSSNVNLPSEIDFIGGEAPPAQENSSLNPAQTMATSLQSRGEVASFLQSQQASGLDRLILLQGNHAIAVQRTTDKSNNHSWLRLDMNPNIPEARYESIDDLTKTTAPYAVIADANAVKNYRRAQSTPTLTQSGS